MTTDNTQELNKLVEKILEPHFDENELSRPDWTPEWSIYQNTKSETRRSILDWHNKQVEAVLGRLEAGKGTAQKSAYGHLRLILDAIDDERNKLKEITNDKDS